MLIQATKVINEPVTIELETPAYFKNTTFGEFYMIADDKVICVSRMMMIVTKSLDSSFNKNASEYSANKPATEAEFIAAHTMFRLATNIQLPASTNNPQY